MLCFEFTSKGNALDEPIMDLLGKTVRLVKERATRRSSSTTRASHFSFGANLGLALFAANIAAWMEIEKLILAGQSAYQQLKYAPFPVVVAPAGMALGGGCEILLHADAVQAHAELYAGLVECGVGLIPGWGGLQGDACCVGRATPPFRAGRCRHRRRSSRWCRRPTVAKSADDAREMKILREHDGISMNRYRLLADAKAKALALAVDYKPPVPGTVHLPGSSGRVAMNMAVADYRRRGLATPHDVTVAAGLAEVLSGGPADPIDDLGEGDLLALERNVFMRLIKTPATVGPHRTYPGDGQTFAELRCYFLRPLAEEGAETKARRTRVLASRR